MFKFCSKCGNRFEPNGRFSKVCDKCKSVVYRKRIEERRK